MMKISSFAKPVLIALFMFLSGLQCVAQNKELTLSFMEMKGVGGGWGEAIVIQTPNGHTYLYDVGRYYAGVSHFDAGKDMIAPFLKKNGIKEIDGVVISHSHADHFGGFEFLMNNFKIGRLYDGGYAETSDPIYDSLWKPAYIANGGDYELVQQGDTLNWDRDLEVVVLSPPKGYLHEHPSNYTDPTLHHNPNLNSVVIRMQYKDNVFLFVGDLTAVGQEYLLKQYSDEALKVSVLCLGHSGSTQEFAEVIRPGIVVQSCLNGLDAPAKKADAVFSRVQSRVHATCWNGTVQVISDGKTCSVITERNDKPRVE